MSNKLKERTLRGCDRCRLKGMSRQIRESSREHFRWSVHNLIAHPLSEIAWLIGLKKLSYWLHDKSIPVHKQKMAVKDKSIYRHNR